VLEPEFCPEPVPETEGGGGMTLEAPSCVPWERPEDAPEDEPPLPEFVPESDGGGGITLDAPCDRPEDEPPWVAPEPPTEGGGGMTFAARDLPYPPDESREVPAALAGETLGGGGTTSWVPKSLPMMLLTKDPLAACVGGGGITLGAEERMPPLSRRPTASVSRISITSPTTWPAAT